MVKPRLSLPSWKSARLRPYAALATMLVVLAASGCWIMAQGAGGIGSLAKSRHHKPFKLSDLPGLVAQYGRRRAAAGLKASTTTASGTKGGFTASATTGITPKLYSLTERDITPNNNSDEREPAFSPGGDFIAFISNGADANKDGQIDSKNSNGRYHVWVMNRNGTQQRQITGLGDDSGRDQKHPAWSPDGNQIVYADGPFASPVTPPAITTQLYVTRPFTDGDPNTAGIQPPREQRTFSPGEKRTPIWSPTGVAIVFATNINPQKVDNVYQPLQSFDIFSIDPSGSELSIVQLTGDAATDAAGVTSDDLNPAFSLVNQGVIFFSSDRDNSSGAAGSKHRRIWLMNANGQSKRQVTDPTQRPAGKPTDDDDYPAPSLDDQGFSERVAFHSNSLIDSSDKTPDLNVWSMLIDTTQFIPTPPPTPPPPPAMMVGSYTGNQVKQYNPRTGAFINVFVNTVIDDSIFPEIFLEHPEGLQFGFDGNLYVCNRDNGKGSVDRFNGSTGAPMPSGNQNGATFATGGGLTNPTGLAFGPFDGRIYVASGSDDGDTSGNAVYRYSSFDGRSAPAANQAGAKFTSGEPDTAKINNGIEGICFGNDINFDGIPDLYVTCLNENRINVYDGRTGKFIKIIVTAGSGGLNIPTDVQFGPDANSDGIEDIYVCSSGNDSVLVYDGNTFDTSGGTFIKTFVADNDGLNSGLAAPERIVFGPDINNDGVPEAYVSSFGHDGLGRVVCRYDGKTGISLPSSGNRGAIFATNLSGAAGIAFNSSAFTSATPTPSPSPTVTTPVPLEDALNSPSILETNRISSPNGFAASNLTGPHAVEDVVADREPSFARSTATPMLISQLAFASQRLTAAVPGPDINNQNDPVVVNKSTDNPPTHDIWITIAEDFTPPILLPQGAGNNQYPVLAPGIQSPIPAPRTYEQGLTPSSSMYVAFVLKEQESGLQTVTLTIKDADQPRFQHFDSLVNNPVIVDVANELAPRAVASDLPVAFYDDGPISKGGHERQAGAIKGDGIYYCEIRVITPTSAGDFYLDVKASDKVGQSMTYDHVWGFSTRQFKKSTLQSDLFVSDYTVGQFFPFELSAVASGRFDFGDPRFFDLPPVESYYLSNPGGGHTDTTTGDFIPPEEEGVDVTTFPNVDVWRILCRGDVPQEVLDAYTPRLTQQLDPTETDASGFPGPFKELKRNVAVATCSVLWASPYTGDVFSGPGTLYDAETQRRLSNFLEAGGRLFVSGREILYSLSNAGQVSNTFMREELQAGFGGETGTNNLAIGPGGFVIWGPPAPPDWNNPQIPILAVPGDPSTYEDAALNSSDFGGMDIISPSGSSAGATVIPAYRAGGSVVAQKVERIRNSGLQSRVFFCSFGFEGINRRYVETFFPLNIRSGIASAMRNYFKTGGISGSVINDATNLPIPNFLIEVDGSGGPYFARTDQNGNFEFQGMPSGGFTVRLATATFQGQNIALNPGFFNITGSRAAFVSGGFTDSGHNFRVIPSPPGSLAGIAVSSHGTKITTDDTRLPNLTVLVRSVEESSLFAGGGHYVQLTHTDAGGRFALSNVPSDTPLEVILNPTINDIPEETGLRGTYSGPDPNYGRRIIPDKNRPDIIKAPIGDSFFLNDGSSDTSTDSGVPIVVPQGRTITGHVFINDIKTPAPGATVDLFLNGVKVQPSVTTDASGAYSFDDVLPGNYALKASANLGASQPSVAQTFVTVVAGKDIVAPNMLLTKQDVVGTVLLNDRPVAGVTVTLAQAGTSDRTDTTLADGSYRFKSVEADPPRDIYTLKATYTPPDRSIAPISTVPFQIRVAKGKDTVAPPIKIYARRISGIVTVNGVAASGASVQLTQGTKVMGNTTTASNGAYAFSFLVPGSYRVRATKNGDTAFKDVSLTTAADVTNANIALLLGSISGRVVAGGSGTGGATVQLLQNGLVLKSTFSAAGTGAYSFKDVAAGSYVLKAIKNNVTTQLTVTLSTRGQSLAAPDLVLGLQTVSGRVLLKNTATSTGTAFGGAIVQLLLNGGVVRSTTSKTDGTFSFLEVPSGSYTLVAIGASDRTPPLPLTVRTGINNTGITLTLVLQMVTGRVTLNGVLTDGVAVQLLQNGALVRGVTPGNPINTANGGTYSFSKVPAGTYTVTASKLLSSGQTASDQKVFSVQRGFNFTVPDLQLRSQTITGRVTLNGVAYQGAAVTLTQSGKLIKSTTSTTNGLYSFTSILPGTYTLKATGRGDTVQLNVTVTSGQNLSAPDLALRLMRVSGKVTLNNTPTANISVALQQNGANVQIASNPTVTQKDGTYQFLLVPAGSYTVLATIGDVAGTANVNVIRGIDAVVGTIALTSSSPSPGGGGTTGIVYDVGVTYAITVPYMDSEAVSATTTVGKAFNVKQQAADGAQNFTLTRYDPLLRQYIPLSDSSVLMRGQGYFLKPLTQQVTMKAPLTAGSAPFPLPTSVAYFAVTLRRDASRPTSDTSNGYNFIGAPFDPAKFSQADWLNATVDVPAGGGQYTHYNSVREAAAAGALSSTLFNYDMSSGQFVAVSGNLQKFKGYFVRTFVDGVIVKLKPVP